MNKKNRRKLSLIFGSFFAASAIAAAITLPIIFTNQYNDKDKNSNQNFNDLVNKILSNKKNLIFIKQIIKFCHNN